jgi:S1-C subfamily serine protease
VTRLVHAYRWLCLAVCSVCCSTNLAQEPGPASQEKLQRLMEQARLRAASPTVVPAASSAAGSPAAKTLLAPARLQERSTLLASAEAALTRSDTTTAQEAFERAALISHAADTEMGLVRTYMQAGQYRRALSFGAHTAGTHLDVVGGAALYALLLHVGGQEAPAKRMLADALGRSPSHPLLIAAQTQLQSGKPLGQGQLLQSPVRMAPYGPGTGLPRSARVAGSGLLIDGGRRALLPLGTLGTAQRVWVRNGLGQLAQARVDKKLVHLQLATLSLTSALPVDAALALADRDAFAGSVGFAVEYTPAPNAVPQWPVLSTGFLGEPSANGTSRALGITLAKGPRGGPVFDSLGRLVGMAVASSSAKDQLVMASQLYAALGAPAGQPTSTLERERMPADQIYEAALRTTVQIIVAR